MATNSYTATVPAQPRRAKLSEMIKYSFGSLGSSLNFLACMTYLTFFYTDVLEISPVAVGTLMLAARLFDAVTDPLMGMLCDRTRTKLGSYRPYIIMCAPLFGLITFMLFCAPSLSPTMKVVYASITYMLNSLFSTMCNIPFHSLAALVTEDTNQRTTLQSVKGFVNLPGQILVTVLAMPIVNCFSDVKTGWFVFGLICGITVTVTFWICAWGTKGIDCAKEKNDASAKKLTIGKQLKLIYGNRPLLMLLIAFGTDQLAFAVANSVNMFYFTYFLNRQDLVPVIGMGSILINLGCMVILPPLTKKFGKKNMYLTFTIASMVPYTILFFMPATDVTAILALLLLAMAFAQIPGLLGWSMLPDCVDYGEWKYGISGAGTVTASFTFTNKCGQAIGAALTGVLLAAGGYVAGQAQTETALETIKFMRFIFPALGYACSVVSMLFYCINESFYKKMMSDLNTKRQMSAEN